MILYLGEAKLWGKRIDRRVSLSVNVVTGNYVDINQNAVYAENVNRIL